jgi:hypothetical protein
MEAAAVVICMGIVWGKEEEEEGSGGWKAFFCEVI